LGQPQFLSSEIFSHKQASFYKGNDAYGSLTKGRTRPYTKSLRVEQGGFYEEFAICRASFDPVACPRVKTWYG
jgi:hypothetical protein